MLSPWQFCIATLALWEILEIWRHSELLADWRAWLGAGDGWLSRLSQCSFCLAPWTGLALLGLLRLGDLHAGGPFLATTGSLALAITTALALARAANVASDLTHRWCRTPGSSALDRE